MRDRIGLEHHPAGLRDGLELEVESRLAGARFRDRSGDLPAPLPRQPGDVPERFNLARAPDELGVTTPGRALEASAQRPESCHLKHRDWLADAFDSARAKRLELKIALDEFLHTLPDHNRARRCECLQARSQAYRMPDGSVFSMGVAGLNRSDHHFSGVDSDPN